MTQPTGHPHPFVTDGSVPADQQGRQACATCHCMGKPGDKRHTMPDVPMDAQRLAAGESGDA